MERNTFKIAEQEMKEKAKEDQEEKKYIICWTGTVSGTTVVMAKSREEAIDKAYEEGTPDDYDHPENWEIDDADEY